MVAPVFGIAKMSKVPKLEPILSPKKTSKLKTLPVNHFPEYMVFKASNDPNQNHHVYSGEEKDPFSITNEQYNADNDTSF